MAQLDLGPGFRLDRYELLRQVARGGMGAVWLARARGKHGFEKFVAVKTILPELAREPSFREMFLQEARLAACVSHANVAQIIDLGEHEPTGHLYIVLEWIDGRSLDVITSRLARRGFTLPLPLVLRIVADACAGLHAAHDARDRQGKPLGLVHCDVSPHNLLVDERGIVKVIDFGVARVRQGVAGESRSGSVRGKVSYMAPEQAEGKAVDARADVWGLGAVLFELLGGAPPVATLAELAEIVAGRREWAPLPAHVPHDVRAIALRALSIAPEGRFASAHDMRHALERALLKRSQPLTSMDVAEFLARYLPQDLSLTLAALDEETAPSPAPVVHTSTAPAAPDVFSARSPRWLLLGVDPRAAEGSAQPIVVASSDEAAMRLRHEQTDAVIVAGARPDALAFLHLAAQVAPAVARVVVEDGLPPDALRRALLTGDAHAAHAAGPLAATVVAARARSAREVWLSRELDDARAENARLVDEEDALRHAIEDMNERLEVVRRNNAHADNAARIGVIGESEARRATALGRPLTVVVYRMRRASEEIPLAEAAIVHDIARHPAAVVAERYGEMVLLVPDESPEQVEARVDRRALVLGGLGVAGHAPGESFARLLERAVEAMRAAEVAP